MTISARRALFSHARGFFETELRGIFSWNDAKADAPRPSEPVHIRRHNGHTITRRDPRGRWREMVEIRFGGFLLTVRSAEDFEHPLGHVLLERGSAQISGPIDQSTWARAGQFVKESFHG